MRFSILFAALTVAVAIRPTFIKDEVGLGVVILMILMLILDMVEFGKNIKKQ
jgi:hypothetical protein